MNNLKEIRELFGATQEDFAKLLQVSRVTISKIENDPDYKMSDAQKEKASLFYYIGPEYFYDKKLSNVAKEAIIKAGKKIKEHDNISHQDVVRGLLDISTSQAMHNYMLSVKILLAKSEDLTIEQLEDIVEVNNKLGIRLKTLLEAKKATNDNISLTQSLNEIVTKYED